MPPAPPPQRAPMRVLPIIMPSGRKQYMVFIRTLTSPVLQVDYGLVPASVELRPPRVPEHHNERLECLSPEVLEDVPERHFFFFEHRTPVDVGPPVLDQLVQLGVLAPTTRMCVKGPLAGKAILVRILLSWDEIAHSCLSGIPNENRHWEAPDQPRFMPCGPCSRVRGRAAVYYCSPACMNGWWNVHQRDCGKTRKELWTYLENVHRVSDPTSRKWIGEGPGKMVAADLTHFIRWPMERKENGCQDLMPGW
ncbi:hypothetical protein CALVIDRAFT_61308 [Calocera viscosa TUFC12733]|uniref:Uncharacterized protein n=1 Tax=Calocera viscosa (strain TUFC12733) TaxID=1330018 RepID=A0A167NLJ0_CALVF|nr:hypothetical protein CALVIDRAFT_61308 [Calocera viscosa TUFC12733]